MISKIKGKMVLAVGVLVILFASNSYSNGFTYVGSTFGQTAWGKIDTDGAGYLIGGGYITSDNLSISLDYHKTDFDSSSADDALVWYEGLRSRLIYDEYFSDSLFWSLGMGFTVWNAERPLDFEVESESGVSPLVTAGLGVGGRNFQVLLDITHQKAGDDLGEVNTVGVAFRYIFGTR